MLTREGVGCHGRRSPVGLLLVVLVAPAVAGCIGEGVFPSQGTETERLEVQGNTSDSTARPHVHDRWDGADRKVLMNGSVTSEGMTAHRREEDFRSRITCSGCGATFRFGLPNGSIVPPGTGNLSVILDWDPATENVEEEAQLIYVAPNGTTNVDRSFDFIDRGSTFKIPVEVAMADGGHAQYSRWRFEVNLYHNVSVELPGVGLYPYTSRVEPAGMTLDVRIVAERAPGPLPLEPPHPDWWTNGPVRTVWNGSGSSHQAGVSHLGVELEGGIWSSRHPWVVIEDDHEPVPPGSKVLVAELNHTSDNVAPAMTPIPKLWWANRWYQGPREWEPDTAETGHHVYRMPMHPEMTDGMYRTNSSRWRFWLSFTGEETDVPDPVWGGTFNGPYRFDGSWDLEITAWNTTRPLS